MFKVNLRLVTPLILLLLGGEGNLCARQPAAMRAQNGEGKIEGVVTDPDRAPIAGALVSLQGVEVNLPRNRRTGRQGRFEFPRLPIGSYTIQIESTPFEITSRSVDVSSGETVVLRVTLRIVPLRETLTVTATGSEQRLGDIPTEVNVLTEEDIKGSAALSLADILKQIPSFSLFRRTSSLVSHPTAQGVSLRGIGASGASRTLVLLDGIPHNDPFGNHVYWSKVPTLQIEKIEVAEGGLSNLYGSSAMSGVIHVTTKRAKRNDLEIKGQTGMRGIGDLEAFGQRRWGRLGLAVGGRVFRIGGYKIVRAEERGPVDVKADSRHQTFNWRLDYTTDSRINLFTNGRVFHEDRQNGTLLQQNSTQETYLGGGLQGRTSEEGAWRVNIFSHIQDFKSDFSRVSSDRQSESIALVQDIPSHDVGVSAQWSGHLYSSHRFSVGGDGRWIGAEDREEVFTPTNVNIRDRLIVASQQLAGFYVEDVVTAIPRVMLVLGARFDSWRNFSASRLETFNPTQQTTLTQFPNTEESAVSPRVGLRVHLRRRVAVRASFYQSFRAPTLNELYRPFRVGNVATEANPDLGPERLTGGEVGLNFPLSPKLFLRVTGFWNRLKNPISNVTLSVSPELITRQRRNLGRTRARGVSGQVEYRHNSQWRFRGGYLFNESTIESNPLQAELVGRFIPQVPRHRAGMGIGYFHPKQLRLNFQARYESVRFDDDQNQLQLGDFFVADLSLSRTLGSRWEPFLSVENLFNRSYPVRAVPVVIIGVPVTVTAGVRFRFFPL